MVISVVKELRESLINYIQFVNQIVVQIIKLPLKTMFIVNNLLIIPQIRPPIILPIKLIIIPTIISPIRPDNTADKLMIINLQWILSLQKRRNVQYSKGTYLLQKNSIYSQNPCDILLVTFAEFCSKPNLLVPSHFLLRISLQSLPSTCFASNGGWSCNLSIPIDPTLLRVSLSKLIELNFHNVLRAKMISIM
jgi:hypothetical protein